VNDTSHDRTEVYDNQATTAKQYLKSDKLLLYVYGGEGGKFLFIA